MYRNFHFIYAGHRVAWIIPLPDWNRGQVLGGDSTIPLLGGVRGGFLGREISVNISRITELPNYPPPKSPPKRGLRRDGSTGSP